MAKKKGGVVRVRIVWFMWLVVHIERVWGAYIDTDRERQSLRLSASTWSFLKALIFFKAALATSVPLVA